MTTGTVLNNVGVMNAQADGAIALCRVIKPAGLDSNNKAEVAVATAAKAASVANIDRVIGVSTPDRDTASGENVNYYSQPGSRVLFTAGAAIAADKDLMATTDGKVIEATFSAGQTTQLVGRSYEAAAADGDLFGGLFFPQLVSGQSLGVQGADLVAANNLVLGSDGNTFEVTGATQINLIASTNFQNGSLITLLFAAGPTVKHNQATAGVNTTIQLAGAADFVATAGDTLSLRLCEIGGVVAWREVSRAVI